MIGQESIRSNFPSHMESSTVLQKHKAALKKPKKKPSYPGFPHPVPSPQICLPRNKRRYVLNHFSSRLMAVEYPGTDIAIEYLLMKYRINQSVHTIRTSGENILLFYKFLEKTGANILTLSNGNIVDYIEYDQDRGMKINTIIGRLRVIYAFVRFMVERDILPMELLQKKIHIKQPEVLPKGIPSEDIEALLTAISKVRDRALILLLLRTGMRIGELLNVKVADIILSEKKILLYVGEKNFEGRVVYFSEDAEAALAAWLQLRNEQKEYLFYSPARENISYVSAWMIMRNLLTKAELRGKGYSLHSLRHTFATTMLNAGLRLEVLQQLLGHKLIDMTLRYAKLSNVTREAEYFKAIAIIEKGGQRESDRVNSQLQAVFEEKKLLSSHS